MSLGQLKQKGAEWLARARHIEYLNEIALSQEELNAFLDDLREWRSLLGDTEETRFALAIAAVNWACYQAEDEGFRDSFTRRILGSFEVRIWAERLGSPIEDAITNWCHIPARTGAYRYVGLVREQAGLAYFHLERFASFLNSLRKETGWAAVQAARDEWLRDAIRQAFGQTCAGTYLCSASGLAFVRAVCRDLVSYYGRRLLTLEDLDCARGYRPGVMRLVVGYLEQQDDAPAAERAPTAHSWAEPRLMLDDSRLYLQFDPGEVSRRLIACKQLSQPLYDPRVLVGALLAPRDTYSGTRTTDDGEEPWTARGWRPTGKDWALFDEAGQFVCTSKDSARVPADSYRLVIDASLAVEQCKVTARYGYLDLEGMCPDVLYAIHAVDLDSGSTLPGLQIQSATTVARPTFEAPAPEIEPWTRYTGINAVWSLSQPVIRLHNWTQENGRRFVVVRRIGAEAPERLAIPPSLDGTARINLSDVPVPSMGRIWLEPKGRTSSADYACRQITFARWPHCRVLAPQVLCAADVTPEVRFVVDSSVRCEVGPWTTALITSEQVYRVPAGTSAVVARFTCGQIGLDLRIPIHRARFVSIESPDIPLYLEPASFIPSSGQPPGAALQFLLAAVPGSSVELVLADCHQASRAITVAHKQIGAAGSCVLQSNEVIDAIRTSGIGLGRFAIHDGVTTAPTEAWYVDLACVPSADTHASLSTIPPDGIAKAFEIVHAVRDGAAVDPAAIGEVMPSNLRAWAALWLSAARLLDGLAIPTQVGERINNRHRRTIEELSDLLQREASLDHATNAVLDAERLIKDWDQFDPHQQLRLLGLDVDRWLGKLKTKRDRIQWISDVERRTTEAVAAVEASAAAPDVPDLLKNAWRQSLLAEHAEPASARKFLSDAADHIHVGQEIMVQPWRDIGQVLLPLYYLRLCLIRSFLNQMRTRQPPKYAHLAWLQLGAIADNLTGARPNKVVALDRLGIAVISPRRDDKALGQALAGTGEHWLDAARTDWLGAWLGWRWMYSLNRPTSEKEQLYTLLRDQAALIPQSLDRDDLIAEIEDARPGVWQ